MRFVCRCHMTSMLQERIWCNFFSKAIFLVQRLMTVWNTMTCYLFLREHNMLFLIGTLIHVNSTNETHRCFLALHVSCLAWSESKLYYFAIYAIYFSLFLVITRISFIVLFSPFIVSIYAAFVAILFPGCAIHLWFCEHDVAASWEPFPHAKSLYSFFVNSYLPLIIDMP